MKDLTKGKPSVLILTFALPIFLANLLQLTYSLADTRIVGTFLGDNALAAVGATTTLSNLIVQFLMGMCNGFAIISAQCFGAKDMDRLRRSLGNSLVLGLLAAVVLTIGGLVFLPADPQISECAGKSAEHSNTVCIRDHSGTCCYITI